jgi:HAD superfamily hydrolase (TIGR01490 family)
MHAAAPRTSPAKPAAFFDLDKTLLDSNSGQLYALYEHREGRLSTLSLLVSTVWLLLHRVSLLNVESAYQRAAGHWRGKSETLVKEQALSWFKREAAHRMAPGGLPVLQRHRDQGLPVVLLSNTSAYIAEAACEVWQMDDWLANLIPIDEQGMIKGVIGLPLCIGEGKALRAEVWAEQHGISLEASHFYTDSISDLPMLERVGHPYVVNPDAKLLAVAKRRGWPVLDWLK